MKNNIITIGATTVTAVVVTWIFISMTATTSMYTSTNKSTQVRVEKTNESQLVSPVENNTMVYNYTAAIRKQENISVEPDIVDQEKATDIVDDISVMPPPLPDNVTMPAGIAAFYPVVPKQNALVDSLQEKFNAELYDEVWAAETEQKLLNLFIKSEAIGNQLEGAACRSTFCRIDVSHMNAEAEQNFIASFATSGQFVDDGERGFYYREADNNGSIRTVFYYARKGHQLPLNTNKKIEVN